jgi:uncharacterized membrane protein
MRHLGRAAVAAILLVAGVGHFNSTETFRAQVPPFLPAPDLIIQVSGVMELALGSWLLFGRRSRARAGIAAALFFVAIFPGNISQFITQTPAFGLDSDVARGVRLLFQPVLIAVALWSTGGWQLLRKYWADRA